MSALTFSASGSRSQSGKYRTEIERAYTVAEVAKLTAWSRRTIVWVFEHERGVVVLCKPGGKRRTFRIPRAVFRRVMQKFTVGRPAVCTGFVQSNPVSSP
jgi:hypothetical protein